MSIGVWVLVCVFPPFLPKGNNFSGFLFVSRTTNLFQIEAYS